ncbi:CerR family C-terminal domain-containing protein [Tuwongella immobilis]|uniref:HTH tetR-type domain-containing protein n=1 Tax=Tuwongella immobilis TaxID=692036 RepID=A0A6C2YKD7_9BACT|nr:CerR family C-terminal domain-containing protein [Tuwongella immobilis]VIP01573.1 family transcriptional regulator : Transcriptional regulator TetR OS=Planctomyces brasiliensis (strain ATCC 49424 / DSM 5305 / JCM 21570 / NBRC 103401 / IFAM 1448) GN=Plabr_3619 PE=4 SV=1: TetR_N: DUF1956 [Tuwongella immobilis]VTR98810.1 family transcriptional regulator : Transcriptional regulator TetR OS=Planctomyces brasiliensis (strain ATCC 49424 / DSM 5305 / JCM 21570 / NBRC 103401 / IFAM 1448) GN=Plabr_3619 
MVETLSDSATPDSTRKRLIDAAEEVFAEMGYEAASIRAICTRADANVAAVNYHFGDKRRLYLEALKHAVADSTAGMRNAPPMPPEMPVEARLTAFIHGLVWGMLSNSRQSAISLMMREMVDPTPEYRMVVQEFIGPLCHQLFGIIQEVLPHADRQHVIMTAFSIVGQALYYRQNQAVTIVLVGGEEAYESLTLDRIAQHIVDFSLAALGLRPSRLMADFGESPK